MGEKNFMEATTEIEAYIEKKNQCLDKISNLLAEACISKVKSGKTNTLENDISNAVKNLPQEDQNYVLKKALTTLAKQLDGGSQSRNTPQKKMSNNIFASRDW